VSLIPLSVMNGRSITFRVQARRPATDPVVALYLRIGKRVLTTTFLTSDSAGAGPIETQWTVAAAGSAAGAGAIPLTKRLDDIRIGVGSGPTRERALARQRFELFSYRLDRDTGNIDLLMPGRTFTGRKTPDGLEVHERRHISGLDVQITTNR
jgi:hypothetical protein